MKMKKQIKQLFKFNIWDLGTLSQGVIFYFAVIEAKLYLLIPFLAILFFQFFHLKFHYLKQRK